jgi:hypothetical protein
MMDSHSMAPALLGESLDGWCLFERILLFVLERPMAEQRVLPLLPDSFITIILEITCWSPK